MSDLGNRIAERIRKEGITQAELSRRANVPFTTLNSMISRGSRSSPHLLKIARALGTTPAYLLGETDNPEAEFADEVMSGEERNLLEMARRLSPNDKSVIAYLVHRLAETSEKTADTLHDRQIALRAAG